MMLVFVIMFTGFGAKMHAMREVDTRCKAAAEVSIVCAELAKSGYVVAGTNKTPGGMED